MLYYECKGVIFYMKKIALILMTLLILTGCRNSKEIDNTESKKDNNFSTRYFKLEKINLDCNLNNITFISEKHIIANNILYEYSANKKYEASNTKCKIIDNNASGYEYIGIIYRNVPYPEHFIKDEKLYNLDKSGFVLVNYNKKDKYYKNIINNYLNNENFYYNNGSYINDKEIRYTPVEEEYTIPLKEKVLFYSYDLKYIITNENVYEIGVDANDKCHIYEDVKCTYTLIKTNKLDDLLDNFKNNISYFDGKYLITKDNNIYRIYR